MTVDLTYINKHFINGVWNEESLKKEFILKKKDKNLLIKYKKNNLNKNTIETMGLFRSVVLDKTKIVCISPPKSLQYDENTHYKLYEFVEGTMMNAWYDFDETKWRISSKSIINAENRFYENQKLFCEMFYECCDNCNFSFDFLDKDICYSFVFQHPNNRIINVVLEPSLYIISAYKNNNNNTFEKILYNDLTYITYKTGVKLPSQYFSPVKEVVSKLINGDAPLTNMGIVLVKEGTNYHCKVRNNTFEIIKKFKTNNTKLINTFLSLKRKNMDELYIRLFPENLQDFNEYLHKYYSLIDYLYNLYYDINVTKCVEISSLDEIYKINLNNIHSFYVQNLRKINKRIDKKYIDNYVLSLKNHLIIRLMNQRFSSINTISC
tara:strand:- start:1208 stop:2344 length:1137 start_codon:yes stop_codon:yes gene_type:complete